MSASLVGSEMCIRDSRPPARSAGRTPGQSVGWRADAWRKARTHARRGLPVSYTHLTLPTICSV
eukprot:11428671-Alexandrium_andersonii.AAC.1